MVENFNEMNEHIFEKLWTRRIGWSMAFCTPSVKTKERSLGEAAEWPDASAVSHWCPAEVPAPTRSLNKPGRSLNESLELRPIFCLVTEISTVGSVGWSVFELF